jgi:DNA-binding transcriptional regulator YiaG
MSHRDDVNALTQRGQVGTAEAFPEEFKALRLALGLTQQQAAARLGMTRTNTVSDWERGVAKVTPQEAALYLSQLKTPRVASTDDYARGFADAIAQVRAAVERLAPPVTGPDATAAYEAALDAGDPKHLQAAPTPRPARTRT